MSKSSSETMDIAGPRITNEIVVNQFDELSAQLFREQVMVAHKEDNLRPIVIYIDSNGGDIDALAKMIDTLDEVSNPIVTVAVGKAMSCGAILLSHGDMRFCGRHSRVMIHEVSLGAAGDIHDVNAASKEGQRLNAHFMGLLAANCNIKGGYAALREVIKKQESRDNYMDAEEAVKFGIVDFVGMPRILKANIYQIDVANARQRRPFHRDMDKKKINKNLVKGRRINKSQIMGQ